jgi:exonuclease III
LIQKKFLNLISTCTIDNSIMGSDHCPILLDLTNDFQAGL